MVGSRETDPVTYQRASMKSISKNSASTSDHLVSILLSQVLFPTVINCFGQEEDCWTYHSASGSSAGSNNSRQNLALAALAK